MEPYEIIGAPFILWLAPTGTAFPAIDAEPAVDWTRIGTNGARNYSDDGVIVTHSQTVAQARPAGATGPVKAWRDAEDLMIGLTLWDLTLEMYQYALNGVAPAATAAGVGSAGIKTVGLSRGVEIIQYSALFRGESPYGPNMNAQYELPRCYQSASPKTTFKKGIPAGLELEFTALEDLNAASDDERFGRFIAQTAPALEA